MYSFPPWGAGEIPLLPRPLSLGLWRTTKTPLTDWINFCFTFCTNPLICHRLNTDFCCFFATKLFYIIFSFLIFAAFLCKCAIDFNEKSNVITMNFHTKHDQITSMASHYIICFFLPWKFVGFQISKQPSNSLLNRSDLKVKVCKKIEWPPRFKITTSAKANRNIMYAHRNIKLNIYPLQRRHSNLQAAYDSDWNYKSQSQVNYTSKKCNEQWLCLS